jgi:hypothetical protein
MLQNWPHGIVIVPDHAMRKWTTHFAAKLTGLPPQTFTKNIEIAPLHPSGYGYVNPQERFLIDEFDRLKPHQRDYLLSTGKVIGYTCTR